MNVTKNALFKRVSYFTLAFVLAVSTLTAAVPFILSEKASAVASHTYEGVSLNPSNWIADRQAPSGWLNVDAANSRVVYSIDQLKSSPIGHHKTEGVKASVPAGTTSLSGRFSIATDWATKQSLRVGLWGVTEAPSWPIVEYAANVDGYTGWRIWDTINGGWLPVDAPTGAGNYTIEITLNTLQNKFNFYINGVNVGSFAAGGVQQFNHVILNSYNLGTGNSADNYVVDWRNLKAGLVPAAPVATSPSGWYAPAANQTTNSTAVQFSWNAPTNGPIPTSYEVITGNHSNVDANGRLTSDVNVRTVNATGTTFTTDLAPGAYQWQVRANYADLTQGPWSNILPVQVIGVPTVTSPTAGEVSNAPSFTAQWTAVNGVGGVEKYEIRYGVDRNNDGEIDKNTDGSVKYEYRTVTGDELSRTQYWSDLEGPLTIAVRAKYNIALGGDFYGPWSATVNYSRDTIAPSVSWQLQPKALYGTGQGFHVRPITNEDGMTKSVYVGSVAPENLVWTLTSHHKNFDTTESSNTTGLWDNLEDGTYTFIAVFSDQVGNTTTVPSESFTIDRAAPVAPVIVNDNVLVKIGQLNKTLNWTHDLNDVTKFEYREYTSLANAEADISNWQKPVDAPTLSTSDTASLTTTTLYWRVVAIDAAGNRSALSDIGKITIDRTAPTSTNDLVDRIGGQVVVTQTVSDNFTPASGKLRIYKLNAQGAQDDTKFFAIGDVAVNSGNQVKYEFNTATQLHGDGDYVAKFTSTDEAGNQTVDHKYFTVDNAAPVATIIDYTPLALTNGDVRVTITFNEAIKTITTGWSAVDNTNTIFDRIYTGNTAGDVVNFSDFLDNSGEATIVITWIDKTNPVVTGIVNGSTIRGTATFGIVDANSTTFTVNGVATTSNQISGNGTYTIVARDAAGNFSAPVTVTINNAQAITFNAIDLETATPLITGTALWVVDPASVESVTVTIDGTPYAATIDAAGNWSVQVVEPLTSGAHTITVNGVSTTFTTTLPTTFNAPAIVSPASAVLGDATQNNTEQNNGSGETGVQGASTAQNLAAADTDLNKGLLFGLAWYWWILILAALTALAWWIIGAIRRRREEQN